MHLRGSVVLVTGASGGIGGAIARAFAARRAELIVTGRDSRSLARVAATCCGQPLAADLRDIGADGDPGAIAARALAVHGRVDVLAHVAGIGWAGPFHEAPVEAIVDLVQVNLTVPLLLTRALLPGMISRGGGHVVLIGSIAGLTGVPGEAVYSATKAALSVFADSLRAECAGTGVGVSTVIPGAVRTGFFERRGAPYDRRVPGPVAPERIADAVLRCVEHDRPHAIVPRWLAVAPRVRAITPEAYRVLSARFGRQPGLLSKNTGTR